MKYINANVILPEKLIEEIQKYIQGKYIYIPNKNRRFSLINKLSLLFLVRLILYYSWCRINNFTSILWIYESYLNILI